MLKRQPSFTPTGKTSVADIGKMDDSTKFTIFNPNGIEKTELDLSSTQTMLDGIDTALKVTDNGLSDAQNNVQNAILNDSDPTHGNFWGSILTGLVADMGSPSSIGTSYSVTSQYKKADPRTIDWAKNAVGYGAIRKNEGEIKADAGEINKYQELIKRGVDL